MKLKTFLITLTLILAISTYSQAADDSGRNLTLAGDSPIALGRGATGISSEGINFFSQNPASIANIERIEVGMRYGSLSGDFHNYGIATAIPTSYGTIGVLFGGLNLPSSTRDIENGYRLSIGGGKDLTESLMIGASLNIFYGKDASSNLFNLGASIGSIYNIKFSKKFGYGFGIWEPSIGASLQLGIPFGSNGQNANFNQLTLGYSFLFYKYTNYSIGFYNEISGIHALREYPLKFGIEASLFKNYSLRTGFIVPSYYHYGSFTAGAGYRLALSSIETRLDYSFVYHKKNDYAHFLGLTIMYGEIDRTPPHIGINTTEQYISPNYDGKQDFLIFKTGVRDRSRIKGWQLQILNQDNVVVREYRLSDRDMNEKLSLKNLYNRIIQKKESLVVPESILWDGSDSKGKTVPDGTYAYSFVVWDERDNISAAKRGTIFVDNTPPALEIRADDLLFSPNGDKQKDSLAIIQKVMSSVDDEWSAGFMDAQGKVIKTFKWKGNAVPQKLIWDGKDDSGADAPEGLYSYFIESTDKAGNHVRKTLRDISLTRQYETADIATQTEYFSPGLQKEVKFFLTLSKIEGLEEWKIIITDPDKKVIKEISGSLPFQKFISWNGKDADGKDAEDGKYFYSLTTRFKSGNTPSSFSKEIIIDNTPPEISLGFSPSIFSPDGDGDNDMLTIYPKARDNFGIMSWSVSIYSSAGELFKSFKGKGNPAPEIKWDGLNEKNEIVESAADYFIEFEVTDLAGNFAPKKRIKLPVDVLVIVTERGLKIRISNIEFAFDSAKLTNKAFPILNRVTELLNKYNNYNVLIEGHTDDIGEEEYNLRLSENRAKSVMDYLISKGIDKERLTFRGMGETAPFLPNTNDENRRRNRRVEFLLIKKDMHQ